MENSDVQRKYSLPTRALKMTVVVLKLWWIGVRNGEINTWDYKINGSTHKLRK